MNRKLASIAIINEVKDIPDADRISLVTLKNLGWQCVSGKNQFQPGEKVVYLEIDSVFERAPWNDFLWKEGDKDKPTLRLKTAKFRKQISQGLVVPLSVLDGKKFKSDVRDNPVYEWHEGQEVTELLGLTKYELAIPACLAGQVAGTFPCFLQKTDETRLQAVPGVLKEIAGKECYITTKVDGSSATIFVNKGEYAVCSRNLMFKEEDTSTYSEVARKYGLKEKMLALGKNLAIQCECYGGGIQGNKLNIKGHDFALFNVYDIDSGKYLNMREAFDIAKALGVPTVPVDAVLIAPSDWTVESLLKLAEGLYLGTQNQREGVVIRPTTECYSAELKGRLSFKIINNLFLLKDGD